MADDSERRLDVCVPEALGGERVDRVVAMLADVSRREAQALISEDRVTVDGRPPAKPSDRLEVGAALVVVVPHRTDVLSPAPDVDVPVVYVDDHLLVVDKPAALVVHPGSGVSDGTMIQALLAVYPDIVDAGGEAERPGIVHRLDRGTSGLLMVARTEVARVSLSGQLADRSVLRRYLTLVWGA
ncbi:MAG: pseudouridine synthase [Acidimicrobiales bacterium]